MRLTLRTLLAYLDDRLSPTDARELGQKIGQSPFATELAERIREVVRRRRLAAPAQNQKMLDPNLLAEYLDDQLTPELVALIEREVLASDFSLAEVAAAHQILGLLGDPVPLENRLKERLHALNPNRSSDAESAAEKSAADEQQTELPGQWSPLAPQTAAQKNSPMIVLMVMVIAWLALIFTDSNLTGSGPAPGDTVAVLDGEDGLPAQPDADDVQNADGAAADDVQPDDSAGPESGVQAADRVPPGDKDPVTDSGQPAGDVPKQPAAGNQAVADAAAGTGKPAMVNGEPADADTAVADAGQPSGDAGTKPAQTTDSGAAKTPDADKVPAAADAKPVPSHRYTLLDAHQTTLLCSRQTGEWTAGQLNRLPAADSASILKESVIGVSEPFRASITTATSGWRAMLIGPALAEVSDSEVAGVRLLEGQIILRNDPTQVGHNEQQIQFRLQTGTASIELAFPEQETLVGIEIIPVRLAASAPDEEAEPVVGGLSAVPYGNDADIRIYVAEGEVTVKGIGDDQSAQLARGRSVALLAAGSSVTAVENSAVQQLGAIPDWVYSADREPVAEVEELKATIAAEFARSSTLSAAALKLSEDRNPRVAQLATRSLYVARRVDDLVGLALSSGSEPVRRAAIDSLYRIIWQAEANEDRVMEILETRLPGSEVDTVFTLLKGVSSIAVQEAETSAWLVGLLESDRVATRELAIYNIERLTGERQSFVADGDAGRRRESVRRWQRFLERNGGVLLKAQ